MAEVKQKGSEHDSHVDRGGVSGMQAGEDVISSHVVFTRTKSGEYLARVDNIEVMLGNRGFEIVSYEERRFIPCDEGDVYVPNYHSGDSGEEPGLYPFENCEAGKCPEGRDPQTCELINNCPFEETGNTWAGGSNFYGGLSCFEEVERMVRNVLKSEYQYKGRHERAARRFARQPWAFDPPLPEWFKVPPRETD